MKKTILAITLAAVFNSPMVSAEMLVIGAGSGSGEYTGTIVPAINEDLQRQKKGLSAKAQISAGSQENIENVMEGKLIAAISQLDVAALAKQLDEDETLAVMGRLSVEALLCAVRTDGTLHTYYDLIDDQDKPRKISVGKPRSGTAKTWEYIIKNDENLDASKVKLLYKKSKTVELARLASGNRDAVCVVITPNPENEFLKQVAEHKNLEFLEFVAPEYVNFKVGDTQIYDFMEVPVEPGVWGFPFGGIKIKTLITWATLVINEDNTTEKQLEGLAKASLNPNLIPPKTLAAKAMKMYEDAKVDLSKITN